MSKGSPANEVRVRSQGSQSAYISYIIKALGESTEGETPVETFDSVTVRGMGQSISSVVNIAEVVKRRVHGLHQITVIASETMPDSDKADNERPDRKVAVIAITLSKTPLDTKNPGYQAPLPDNMVEAEDPEKRSKGRGAGRGRGGPRGRGRRTSESGENQEKFDDFAPRASRGRGRGRERGQK
ncbi:hypothetical protein XU18_3624 [Perkinsela sp. CCAP 1560/4]|nr:hypothetical protein XU18_3624 [Perkinsela sp. CCAP 1560/4]|eukprot:KNH05305.1 hypothetical protein XU18_3624 [Perkinsela sp. CCAP 1560/4]